MSGGEGAADRVVRLVAALFGVGSVVFVALLAPVILDQDTTEVPWWWTAAVLTGVLLTPVATSMTAFVIPVRRVQWLAAVTAGSYLVALLTLPLVQQHRLGVHDPAPWILGLTALGTTAAAIAWRPRWAWAYLGAVGLLVALDRVWTAAAPLTEVALQDAAYATFFCAVFCALAIGARHAGGTIDDAARAALAAEAETAAHRAREQERRRVDALVHDEVLATLLLASRSAGHLEPPVRDAASVALERLQALASEPASGAGHTSLDQLVSGLRAEATRLSPATAVSIALPGEDAPLPAAVAESLLAATGEALRNVRRHAGSGAASRLEVCREQGRLVVRITDDGGGFDPAAVDPSRLGLAGSVLERMRVVGGRAQVRSAPGDGTEVRLQWPAE